MNLQRVQTMKILSLLAALFLLSQTARGGESSLTTTFQPLDGLGSGEIHIRPVTCHDWYSHSGQITAIGLISAPNVPPTNNPKEATENLNLASVYGIRFICDDPEAAHKVVLHARSFTASERHKYPRDQVVRACLECLRLCLPEKLRKLPVVLEASDPDREWLTKIVQEFNSGDRSKPFFAPPS